MYNIHESLKKKVWHKIGWWLFLTQIRQAEIPVRYKKIYDFHGCEMRIENSVMRVTAEQLSGVKEFSIRTQQPL